MKTRKKPNRLLGPSIIVLGVLSAAPHLPAGHPIWPPPPHSAGYRQANMLFLRFQDAIASERFQDALALCSDRVQSSAAQAQSPADFFRETMPIQNLLAQDFGCWSCASNFFGLFVPLSEPGADFSSAINSTSVFALTSGLTRTTWLLRATMATGVKSLIGS